MDLLSAVGMATKRRGDYFQQAETLAKKVKDREDLENRMKQDSRAVVKGLRDKQIRLEEYERTLLDKTLISALAAVYLGSEGKKPYEKMEKAWPVIVGDMLTPLVAFLKETEARLEDGTLKIGDQTVDFADGDPEEIATDELQEKYGVGQTWLGVLSRVIRYLANPAYSFFDLGRYYVREEQGFKEMRRVPKLDKRTCPDCINFGSLGWQPLGTLPMPGRECQCYDHCRCSIEYR
jgi:hypothetical protein